MPAVWKEKITGKGVLKYRHPDVVEGFDFLASIERIQTLQDTFKVKGKFISMMGPMIDYSELGYPSWEDFLRDTENNMIPLKEIADEIFIEVTKVLVKKA